MKITLFTPTYNRSYILHRLYRSIQDQTFRDFEWLIVDDGSTDNTDELVQSWMDENNNFSIRYYKQRNGGKCRAINWALELAEGELFFVIDSDDYLMENALEKVVIWERQLPKESGYCGVSGNLGISEDETPNYQFDEDYYDGNLLDRYGNMNGERAFIFYTDVHRQYLYPVFDDEKFMTEAVVYNRIAHDKYKIRFYNDIVGVYEYHDDGLTKAGNRLFLQNPKGYGLWLREKADFMGEGLKEKFRLWYAFYCEMTFCEFPYRLTKRQCATCIGAPLWAIRIAAACHKATSLVKRIYMK